MVNTGAIIRLVDVYKSFGPERVLRGIDIDIRTGETTVIIGPSGCGKSVLLKHMVVLLRPDSGEVFFCGEKISNLSERRLSSIRQDMGFLFQGSALFDSMTVEQNICFPLMEHDRGDPDERKRRAREVLQLVGLDNLQDRFPVELSGGQKKRVALARAIVMHPRIILYDEPTTGLDPIRADLINELIIRLRNVLGNTAVVVTHDMASARKVGDRILMLHHGNFILDTTPDELDDVNDEVVTRFIKGYASPEELSELDNGQFAIPEKDEQ